MRGDPRTPDELHDVLRRRGDLRVDEYDTRSCRPSAARAPGGARPHRWRGAPDRGRGCRPLPRRARRDAAVRAAGGRSSRAGEEPLQLAGRPLRALPRPVHDRARRTSGSAATSSPSCARSSARRSSSAASCGRAAPSASGATPTSSAGCAARRSPRCARRSSRPSRRRSGASCRAGTASTARATLREALVPLQALSLPVALWESEVLPRRVPGYRPGAARPALRDRRGRLGRRRARPGRALLPRGRRGARPARRRRRARGRGARPDPRRARRRAPSSGSTCSPTTGLEAEAALPALWDLVWAGEVTNDAWQPLRAGRRYGVPEAGAAAAPLLAPRARPAITATQGRWSLAERLFAGDARPPRARRAAARAAGDRHARRRPRRGDRRRLRRGLRRAEGARDARPLPPRLLRRGPRRRAVRARRRGRAAARAAAAGGRGGGAARARRRRPGAALRRGACRGRSGPERRAARVAGAYVVLLGGRPALFVERGGRSLVPLRDPGRGVAAGRARRARRPRAPVQAQAPRGRALRRRAGRRERVRCRCSSRPASSPARAGPSCGRSGEVPLWHVGLARPARPVGTTAI